MTSIHDQPRPTMGVLLAGFAFVAAACSSYAGTSGGLVAESAVAPTPAASAAPAARRRHPHRPPAAAGTAVATSRRLRGRSRLRRRRRRTAAARRTQPSVKVASGAVGTFLTGANGMTLYVFKKDSPDKSACSGDCASNWPPFVVGAGEKRHGR